MDLNIVPSIWGKILEVMIHLITTGELYTTLKHLDVRSGKISTVITDLSSEYSDVLPGGIATITMYTPTQCKNLRSGWISMLTTNIHDRDSQYSVGLPGGIATIRMYTPTQCENVQSGWISMLTTDIHDRFSQTHRHVLWLE
jgi:hypothetical protein